MNFVAEYWWLWLILWVFSTHNLLKMMGESVHAGVRSTGGGLQRYRKAYTFRVLTLGFLFPGIWFGQRVSWSNPAVLSGAFNSIIWVASVVLLLFSIL